MASQVRVVHFLNQFFAGLGAEEKANTPVSVVEGAVGPGRVLERSFGDQGRVVATVISGDNYFNEELGAATVAVREALARFKPHVVVAGPALNAGRYGLACGEVCSIALEAGIPAVTGMFAENPGVLQYRRRVFIVPTGETPADMTRNIQTMARLALKMARGEELGPPEVEGYLQRGIRQPGMRAKPGAERAADMLVARLAGRAFQTELSIEMPEQVTPAAPLTDLSSTTIALITTGGLVPKGNPDRLARGGAKEYFEYSIEGLESMTPDRWESVHRGFYTGIVNENPNYILPLNILRELEREGAIGNLHPTYFSTSGVGTAVAEARRMGAEIGRHLKEAGVNAAVMVAT
jgi:glycine reductase